MAVILDLAVQGAQMLVVLLLAPLLTGLTRKVRARILSRRGPPLLQPYRDLIRLMRKDAPKARLVLSVDLIGQAVSVEVDAADVKAY